MSAFPAQPVRNLSLPAGPRPCVQRSLQGAANSGEIA
jgi:hypothetical protein